MRFALVTETWPPEVNGVAHTVHGLDAGLRELGHEVALVRPRQPSPAGDDPRHLLVRGAALPRYPGLRFGFPATGALVKHWSRQRPDAIYVATEGPLGWSALSAAKRLGLPAATGFHTRFDDYVSRYGAGFLAPAAFGWLRRLHNRGWATIAPTHALAQLLRERGFQRVEVVGRAVDTARLHPRHRDPALRASWGAGENTLVVTHVGRIAPEKNLELAVRAFRRIRERVTDSMFVFVGDGPARAALQARHPDLVYAGMRHGADLAAHFASADLFVFPSLSETFGNVTLEAMASGVALVAYDYAAAREHARDGFSAACVACGDEDAFIAASVQLALGPTLRKRYANAARRHIESLSPHAVQQAFANVLCGLVDEARGAPMRTAR